MIPLVIFPSIIEEEDLADNYLEVPRYLYNSTGEGQVLLGQKRGERVFNLKLNSTSISAGTVESLFDVNTAVVYQATNDGYFCLVLSAGGTGALTAEVYEGPTQNSTVSATLLYTAKFTTTNTRFTTPVLKVTAGNYITVKNASGGSQTLAIPLTNGSLAVEIL